MARRVKSYRCVLGIGLIVFLCWISYWFFSSSILPSDDFNSFQSNKFKSHQRITNTIERTKNLGDDSLKDRRQNSRIDDEMNNDLSKRIDDSVVEKETEEIEYRINNRPKFSPLKNMEAVRKKSENFDSAAVLYSETVNQKQFKQTEQIRQPPRVEPKAMVTRKNKDPIPADDDDDLSEIEVESKYYTKPTTLIEQIPKLIPTNASRSRFISVTSGINSVPLLQPSNPDSMHSMQNLSSWIRNITTPPQPLLKQWKQEQATMPVGSYYSLIHNGVISNIRKDIHVRGDRSPSIGGVSSDLYILTASRLPRNEYLRPGVGNGVVGTIAKSQNVYMSGLYNGLIADSHRAALPSTCSFNITHSEPAQNISRTYSLNMARGVYSEVLQADTWNATYQLYAHRKLSGLIVAEVDLTCSKPGLNVKLMLDVNKWTPSYDVTFVERESGMEEVSYKVGTVKAPEHLDQPAARVHLLYDHVPSELSLPDKSSLRTKWVFLSVYGTSRAEVFNLYNRSVHQMHGRDALYWGHVDSWMKLWSSSRIDVTSEVPTHTLGQAIYSAWYSLLSSVPLRQSDVFVGLSGAGLSHCSASRLNPDHVTWEQEMLIYPPLLLFHPSSAWKVLTSRLKLSAGAMLNAQLSGVRGAAFPSRSGASGIELHENGSQASSRSPHVSAGVAVSVLQWIYATHNHSIVTRGPLGDLLANISHFLISKAYPQQDHYVIKDVVPPDNSHGTVNNSPFINGIISQALSAIGYIHSLDNKIVDQWNTYSEKIEPRYEQQFGIHPAFDGYQKNEPVKEADAVLLGYPLNMKSLEVDSRRNDLEHYERMLEADVSPWTLAMHVIGWLELNEPVRAEQNFHKLLPLVNNPFKIWASHPVHTADSPSSHVIYNHLPTGASFLQTLINGYAGIRLQSDRVSLSPSLPPDTSSLCLQGLRYLGHNIIVNITSEYMTVKASAINAEQSIQLMLYVYNSDEKYALNDSKQSVRIKLRKAYIAAAKQ